MDSLTPKCCEEILSILLEKNEKIFELSSIHEDFEVLDHSIDSLLKRSKNLLEIKKSLVKTSEDQKNSQKIQVLAVHKDRNLTGAQWILTILCIFGVFLALFINNPQVISKVLIR